MTDPVLSVVAPPPARRYGWRRPTKENTTQPTFLLRSNPLRRLPGAVDLRQSPHFPGVYDQTSLGSCVCNAVLTNYQYMRGTEGAEPFEPSRLFLYYCIREKNNTLFEDVGSSVSDGFRMLQSTGVCSETHWPYDIEQWTVSPPPSAYEFANDNRIVLWRRLMQNLTQIKLALAEGLLVVFGMEVFEDFESDELAHGHRHVVRLPSEGEESRGGHCVVAVGYDDEKYGGSLLVANSWGKRWGHSGFFYLPYAYVNNKNLCSEFSTITIGSRSRSRTMSSSSSAEATASAGLQTENNPLHPPTDPRPSEPRRDADTAADSSPPSTSH
jgi:C1A family cysteine protease